MFKSMKFLLSFLYLIITRLNFYLYKFKVLRTHSFKNKIVVSVGNLSAGGAGKTPFVCLLSNMFKKLKKNMQ